MPMHSLIDIQHNYLKTPGSIWQYYIEDSNDTLTNSESFKNKMKITGKPPAIAIQKMLI